MSYRAESVVDRRAEDPAWRSVSKETRAWNSLANHPILSRIPIMVSVSMDTVAKAHSHLLVHQYEGLIKKSKPKGRPGS